MNNKRFRLTRLFIMMAVVGVAISWTAPGETVDLRRAEETRRTDASGASSRLQTPAVIVQTAASPGSGVLIGRRGKTYTVLTAAHVIKGNRPDEIQITTASGSSYPPTSMEVPFREYDLAVLQFQSNESIPIAIMPFLDKELWNQSSDYTMVAVSGYAISSSSVQSSPLRETKGELIALMKDNADGYNLMYNAVTNVGMSGSGVFTHPGYGKFMPFMYRTPQGARYGYTDMSAVTAGYASSPKTTREGLQSWNSSLMNASQNYYYQQHCANLSGVALMPCVAYARQASGICIEDTSQNSASLVSRLLLIGIHGRSEEYLYGGKSGSALGIYLGEPKIKDWLAKNKDQFGLAPEFAYAKRSCEAGRPIEPTPFPSMDGVMRGRPVR